MTDHSTDGGDAGSADTTSGDAREAGKVSGDAVQGDARKLDQMSRSSIESRLKSMYDEVAAEPVPDRFLDLLNRLERSEAPEGGAGADDEGGAR